MVFPLSTACEIDDYRWLVSDEAIPWLERAASDATPLAVRVSRLRRDLSAQRTHLVLEQAELRARARAKFAIPSRMFFTRKGLEQATDQWVAAYKATRFPAEGPVADLCCGMGGDLLALAQRGEAVGLERDPVVALLAEANLRALDLQGKVVVGDVVEFMASEFSAWHVDPDRRPTGRRTTHPELHDPPLALLEEHLARSARAAIKLAPAADVPDRWAACAELEWISRDRQCRQLVAWFGALANGAGRRATILGADSTQPMRTLAGDASVRAPIAAQIGRYVFDPDPAVVAAGLVGSLAAEHRLGAWEAGGAYLTGDVTVADRALSCFEVTDVLPFDLKRLKRLLADRDVGQLEIKKRGVPQEPETIRRQLRLRGSAAAVLLIASQGGAVKAVLARRKG